MAGAEPEITENVGKESLKIIASQIEKISKDEYANTRGVDQELAAIKLLQLAPWLNSQEIQEEFAKLPETLFDSSIVGYIDPSSRAVLYLWGQFKMVKEASKDPKLPASLSEAAMDVRLRMLKLVFYHFENHTELKPIIDFIRSGAGYRDTAQDLVQLAKIYEEHAEEINWDRTHYRAEDVNTAYKLSARIHEELDAQSDKKVSEIQNQLLRSWTLLVNTWDELCDAGRFLFRRDSEKRDRFVSIYSLGRQSSKGSTSTDSTTNQNQP